MPRPWLCLCFLLIVCAALLPSGCRRGIPSNSQSHADEPAEAKGTPIRFITADREEWSRLPLFWNDQTTESGRSITVKVPLGLDDPTGHIPEGDPPTLEKWQIGKQLFFDRTLLPTDGKNLACATCHHPSFSFSDGFPPLDRFSKHTPTLLNCVYGKEFFWDGRAVGLEDLLEGSLRNALEIPDLNPRQHHIWEVTIDLVREDPKLVEQIKAVFGARPNRQNVARCLATYLRTILCGNSIQDRAEQARQERKGDSILPRDYEKVLDDATIHSLDALQKRAEIGADELDSSKRAALAEQLHLGCTLFHGKARCSRCHSGAEYTDNGFHNIGIGESELPTSQAPELGRYGVLKARSPESQDAPSEQFIGAFRTPSLRGLGHSAPYFHTGLQSNLLLAIAMHVKKHLMQRMDHLDPELLDNGKPIDLSDTDIRALVLFVLSLEGDPPDDVLAK